jgi:hypothetical protein
MAGAPAANDVFVDRWLAGSLLKPAGKPWTQLIFLAAVEVVL